MNEKVGVIGLGEIGKPVAKRLMAHGYQVTVCGHVNRQPIEELVKLGAKEARSPKELAANSEVIITVVANTTQTEEVIWGKDGVTEGVKAGSTLVIMSTIDPFFVQKTAAKLKEKRVAVLDAPVSAFRGSTVEEGKMVIMVGGDEAVFQKYRPIFELWNHVFYLGGSGMGEVCKVANNMLMFLNMASLTQAKTITSGMGLDWGKFFDVLQVSSGYSRAVERWPAMAASFAEWRKKGVRPWDLMYKDVSIAFDIAEQLKVKVPIPGLVYQLDFDVK